jgi:phosphate transport system substrate-binding protein
MAIRSLTGFALGVALAVATACSPETPAIRTPDPLAGDYVLRGGGGALDTVTALTTAFTNEHPGVRWQGFEDIGSDASIKLVISGEGDLGFISRELRPAEVGTVRIMSIGRSGTALAVNAGSAVRGLTKEQVAEIYRGNITDWNTVGGVAGPIRPFIREAGSAVRTTFESYFFGATKPTYSKNVVEVNNADQTIIALGGFKDSIGMLSMSAQAYSAMTIRLLAIDGVRATRATVADGTYKMLRPLYLVYNVDPAKVKPAIKAFLDWVQSPTGQQLLAGL